MPGRKKKYYKPNDAYEITAPFYTTANNEATTITLETSDNNNEIISDGSRLINETGESFNNNNEQIYYGTKDDDNNDNQRDLSSASTESKTENVLDIERTIGVETVTLSQAVSPIYPSHDTPYGHNDNIGISENHNNSDKCIRLPLPGKRDLPNDILRLFAGFTQRQIGSTLHQVQKAKEEFWAKEDKKSENDRMTKEISRRMRIHVEEEFRSYTLKEFPTYAICVTNALTMIENRSYGLYIRNEQNKILAVQNIYGTWSAIKGHLKFKKNGKLETILECIIRELLEEVIVEYKENDITVSMTENNILEYLPLNKDKLLQRRVNSRRGTNDEKRLIGLIVSTIDEIKWTFTLKDKKENQDCRWFTMDEILDDTDEAGSNDFYTLRPFVEHLRRHPEF